MRAARPKTDDRRRSVACRVSAHSAVVRKEGADKRTIARGRDAFRWTATADNESELFCSLFLYFVRSTIQVVSFRHNQLSSSHHRAPLASTLRRWIAMTDGPMMSGYQIISSGFVCQACGQRGADVRSPFDWKAMPVGGMGYRSIT